MSGRHRRVEPDALAGVDVAASLAAGPVIQAELPELPELDEPADLPEPAQPSPARRPAPREVSSYAAVSVTPVPTRGANGAAVGGRRDRAAERAARRATARRRALTVGAAALAALLLVGVVAVLISSTSGGSGGKPPAAKSAATQQTLLVQAAGPDGTAAASALVGLTPAKKTATALLIPSGLLVDVASSGNMPFGETSTLTSQPAAPRDALTDLLGVRVQHRWMLSTKGLAALVDKVGGVQAQVDADVVVKDAQGRDTVMARAGSQRLAGPAAAAYATYLADGEGDASRLARFNEVFDAVVRALPGSPAQVASTIGALGSGSQSDLSATRLAALISDLRTAATGGDVRYEVLPTNDIDTGSAVDSYGLDSSKAGALLQTFFAGSLQKDTTGDSVRVLVENGVGTPDLIEGARNKLVKIGLRFVNGGNAGDLSDDPSVVLIQDGSEKSTRRGQRVAATLGLPSSAIQVNPRGQTVADVIVILGSDFKP
ncbi:MAG: LCP family protein [Actinomycetes bacterium]